MSRRYALIEHSGNENFPDTQVEITKNFRYALGWFKARNHCARETSSGVRYVRVVYEMKNTFRPPKQGELELLAMAATSPERPVTWRDTLAYICVQHGRNVDLSNYG